MRLLASLKASRRASWLAWCGLAACAASACHERTEPPGAIPAPSSSVSTGRDVGSVAEVEPVSSSAPRARAGKRGKRDADVDDAPGAEQGDGAVGGVLDNLPFDETGKDVIKLASIAWRTWVYTDTGPTRTRYGYLRAGAVVAARGPKITNEGCDGGWYRVNPRGFVCLGLGASTDLMHPVVQASQGRAVRGDGLPYVYALSSDTPPFLYFRLPTLQQMRESEGDEITTRAANFRARIKASGLLAALGEIAGPPDFLKDDSRLPKPYGVKQPLRYAYHAGQAAADSGFAISKVFDHESRLFGLSTELDVIALDRLKLVRQSAFHGVEIGPDEGLPVAFAKEHYGQRWNRVGNDFMAGPVMGDREGVKLTGQSKLGYLETRDGNWVLESSMRVIAARDSFPSFATGDRKWIDISIKQQSLVAYAGKTPVYATLISSGRAGLGDPDKTESTPRGTFMVYQKEAASTMDGDEDKGDSYNLRDVPFVQYFHKGYALHGAYWHDDFGKVRSHGCVNLAPKDAAWLFEWTDPSVPKDWHGVLNKERGTVVHIHP